MAIDDFQERQVQKIFSYPWLIIVMSIELRSFISRKESDNEIVLPLFNKAGSTSKKGVHYKIDKDKNYIQFEIKYISQ